jgi:hypothetical protein
MLVFPNDMGIFIVFSDGLFTILSISGAAFWSRQEGRTDRGIFCGIPGGQTGRILVESTGGLIG